MTDPDLEITTDDNGVVRSILFHDGPMRAFFAAYPELVLLDATYKLTNVRMPVYVLLCIGANGESEVVGIFLTTHEDSATLQELFGQFKAKNPRWTDIRTVMTDKDMAERDAVRQQLPDVSLLLCLFHVLRAMGREVTTSKMNLSDNQRAAALSSLQKLAYAKSESDYNSLRADLHANCPASVSQYFEANWHPCRSEWVLYWQRQNVTFGERTNNRMESINRRFKAVIKTSSSLPKFFRDLVHTLNCMRQERTHAALTVTDKVKVHLRPLDAVQVEYFNFLTPFAYSLFLKQMKLADASTQDALPVDVSADACPCGYTDTLGLPCWHMLAHRKSQGNSFTVTGIWPRWMKSTMLTNCQTQRASNVNGSHPAPAVHQQHRALTTSEKFQRCKRVGQNLVSLACEGGTDLFRIRMAALERLQLIWEWNGTAVITEEVS